MRLGRAHLLLALAALLLTGCDGQSTSSGLPTDRDTNGPGTDDVSAAGGASATSDAAVLQGFALPNVSVNDRAALAFASERLVAECMSRKGFRFVAIDIATASAIAEARQDEDRADRPLDDVIEPTGYLPLPVAPARVFDNDAYANSLDDATRIAWSRAALGEFDDAVTVNLPDGSQVSIPKTGCLTEARVALFGSAENAIMFEMGVASISVTAVTSANADPDVVTARAEWARCMSASGWAFEHFTQARQYAYQHPDEAMSVWTADRSCTRSSRLREVFGRAWQRSMEGLVDANLGVIEEYRLTIGQAIGRATELLAS